VKSVNTSKKLSPESSSVALRLMFTTWPVDSWDGLVWRRIGPTNGFGWTPVRFIETISVSM